MSENPPRLSASESESPTEDADRLVRGILDNRLSLNDISPSGELIRAIGRYNSRRLSQARYITGQFQESRVASPVSSGPISPGREGLQDLQDTIDFLARIPAATTASVSDTAGSRRSRPRITERSRYLDRHRNTIENRHTSMASNIRGNTLSSLVDLHHARQQPEAANQHMRALLDDSQSILAQSSITSEEYAGEAETNRAIKRRKHDNGISSLGFPGFLYGHYGQVEPGKLRMEIESCDGGSFLDTFGVSSAGSAAENILKSDGSIYCKKGNRCNLVLRHQGATPFSLTELIIKGPPRDYTDPIQEGMIFVSMEADDLLTRTAQYQIQYSPPRNTRRRADRDHNNDGIISVRHIADGIRADLENERRQHVYPSGSEGHDFRFAQLPHDFFVQNAPAFNVTTERSNSDTETNRRPNRRRDADRISDRLSAFLSGVPDPTDDSSSDNSDLEQTRREDYLLGVPHRGSRIPSLPSLRNTRRIAPYLIGTERISAGLASAVTAAEEATSEAVKALGGTASIDAAGPSTGRTNSLMAPLAWFLIEHDNSKCVIKFDPPVSGRFILLKIWSPQHTQAGNIDIQSVVAKGFAGPRFFPAAKLR